MRRRVGCLLVSGICLWLMLACQLPQPPNVTIATSEATTRSPLDEGVSTSPDLTPVFFAALAGLLFVATGVGVYLLVRRTPRQKSISDVASSADDRALPEGTLLDDGHFLILGMHTQADAPPVGLTTYEVKATKPLPLCPRCYATRTLDDQQTCAACGAEIPDDRPQHPVLLARETEDGARFATTSRLLAMELGHRAIILPVTVFAETAFGVTRFFQIEPILRFGLEEETADRLREAQDPDAVLAWSIDLMEGLSYLHEHGVVFERVTPGQILLDDDGAHWICFDGLEVLTEEISGKALDATDPVFRQKRRSNLEDLANLLLGMLQGETETAPDGTLVAAVEGIIAQAVVSSGEETELSEAGEAVARLQSARRDLLRTRSATYDIGGSTHVGRHRELNEDSLFAMDYSSMFKAWGTVAAIGVADGVGGQAAGDVASGLAVEAIAEVGDELGDLARADKLPDAPSWVVEAAQAANQVVYAERESAGNDMACTLVLALLVGRLATILNVGDSRAYHLKQDRIEQITVDHSLVERLVAIGQLTREAARRHPQKSVIYRVVGDELPLQSDMFEVALSPGEALLLCSDGLTDMVEDDLILDVWQQASSSQAACERLVALANEAGGYDNITVVILRIRD
ncbi:MAG: protein phosphatase 2C domain-containing protein [Anaerolineae bacterium]